MPIQGTCTSSPDILTWTFLRGAFFFSLFLLFPTSIHVSPPQIRCHIHPSATGLFQLPSDPFPRSILYPFSKMGNVRLIPLGACPGRSSEHVKGVLISVREQGAKAQQKRERNQKEGKAAKSQLKVVRLRCSLVEGF